MKCPVCGKEYGAGTLRCRKCEVLLPQEDAAAAPISTARDAAKQNQRAPLVLWSGQDPVLFSAVTHALAGAAIPFYESAVHDPAVGLFASFPLRSDAIGGFEIRVAGCDLAAAREILDSIVGSIGAIDSDEPASSGPEEDEHNFEGGRGGASRNTDEWRGAEATAEVWNGDDEAWAAYLIDVLWENGVQALTVEDSGAAISRVMVRPSDFVRAQHVLRLLEEASSSD